MKHLFQLAAAFLVGCALTGVPALATTLTKEVAFSRALTVNGAPVKAGTYKVTFDDQTGRLTILDGKKVVAQASARIDQVMKGAGGVYTSRTEGGSTVLLSVYMGGDKQATITNDAGLPVGRANQATILKSIGITAP